MENRAEFMIKSGYGKLRTSERKVADYILEHLEEAREMPMEKLARNSGVSQPTVVRMAKALGFRGYKDFRYALVEAFVQSENVKEELFAMYGYSLKKGEALENIPAKVVTTTEKILENMMQNISIKNYKKVIEAIRNARSVDIYSVENSNPAAQDLFAKLLYLGIDCRYMQDCYYSRISARHLTKDDVAIGISYSGSSKDTVEALRLAGKSGATTIVITNFQNSLITQYADIIICTGQEQTFYGDAIFSRTAQIAIVDMIYMGLISTDYDRYAKCLDKNSQVIEDKAYHNTES